MAESGNGRKDVSISEYELDFFNIWYIFYIDDFRVKHSSLRDSLNTVPACSSRAQHTHFKDKTDMIEANTTYLWQTQSRVDAKILCASVPASLTNNIHADIGVSSPVSDFLISGNTLLLQGWAQTKLAAFVFGRPRCGIHFPATGLRHGKIQRFRWHISKKQQIATGDSPICGLGLKRR